MKYTDNLSLPKVIEKIESRETFSLSRWGNGEWNSILRLCSLSQVNASKHRYFPEIGSQLDLILKSKPEYYLGLQSGLISPNHKYYIYYNQKIQNYHKINNLELEYCNGDLFHKASMKNKLIPFIKCLKKVPIILVGPDFFSELYNIFNVVDHIQTPIIDCWLEIDNIFNRLISVLNKQTNSAFVSISFSLSAGILIDNLYKNFQNKHWFVDVGSLWDPYCGVLSRAYHKRIQKSLIVSV